MSIYPKDDRYEPSAAEARDLHRDALAKKHGLQDHPKLQKLYDLAYDRGHSCGFDEVEQEFAELSVLLKDE